MNFVGCGFSWKVGFGELYEYGGSGKLLVAIYYFMDNLFNLYRKLETSCLVNYYCILMAKKETSSNITN